MKTRFIHINCNILNAHAWFNWENLRTSIAISLKWYICNNTTFKTVNIKQFERVVQQEYLYSLNKPDWTQDHISSQTHGYQLDPAEALVEYRRDSISDEKSQQSPRDESISDQLHRRLWKDWCFHADYIDHPLLPICIALN